MASFYVEMEMGDDSFDQYLRSRSPSPRGNVDYHGSSHAAHTRGSFSVSCISCKPSCSDMSKCGSIIYGLLNISNTFMDAPPKYNIEDVIGYSFENHKKACNGIADWLKEKLSSYGNINVHSEQELPGPYK